MLSSNAQLVGVGGEGDGLPEYIAHAFRQMMVLCDRTLAMRTRARERAFAST